LIKYFDEKKINRTDGKFLQRLKTLRENFIGTKNVDGKFYRN